MKGAKKQEDADLSSRVSTQMMTTTMTSELGAVSHQGNWYSILKWSYRLNEEYGKEGRDIDDLGGWWRRRRIHSK